MHITTVDLFHLSTENDVPKASDARALQRRDVLDGRAAHHDAQQGIARSQDHLWKLKILKQIQVRS